MSRIVALDRLLLRELIEHERDPLTAEMASGPHVEHEAMIAASHGNAFAMIDGAYVVAGAWMTLRWAGLAEAVALITTEARKRHLVKMARFARAHIERRQRDPAFRRIQTYVRCSSCWRATDFARAMGFTELRRLEAWDPAGRDMWLCARIRRGEV